jgi:hypothetical protein
MALLKGGLFAGALFAGVLLGGIQEAPALEQSSGGRIERQRIIKVKHIPVSGVSHQEQNSTAFIESWQPSDQTFSVVYQRQFSNAIVEAIEEEFVQLSIQSAAITRPVVSKPVLPILALVQNKSSVSQSQHSVSSITPRWFDISLQASSNQEQESFSTTAAVLHRISAVSGQKHISIAVQNVTDPDLEEFAKTYFVLSEFGDSDGHAAIMAMVLTQS